MKTQDKVSFLARKETLRYAKEFVVHSTADSSRTRMTKDAALEVLEEYEKILKKEEAAHEEASAP